MKLYGIDIFRNSLLVKTETRRVPGGYMNRWLIRAQVQVPYAVHDQINNCIQMHPLLFANLMRESKVFPA